MTRQTPSTYWHKSACLAFCVSAALSTSAFGSDTPTANAAAANGSVATDAQTQDAKNLDTVQVNGVANQVGAIAPTQGSTIATQPQSIIGSTYIQENIPPTGDYTDAIAISPSTYTIAPNGSGLMETSVASIRGFQDGQYNVTFDGIPWGDSNDFTHHSTS